MLVIKKYVILSSQIIKALGKLQEPSLSTLLDIFLQAQRISAEELIDVQIPDNLCELLIEAYQDTEVVTHLDFIKRI